MSKYTEIKEEDVELNGNEIEIYYENDYSGALYFTIKREIMEKILCSKCPIKNITCSFYRRNKESCKNCEIKCAEYLSVFKE
jgi:hypothetical protein